MASKALIRTGASLLSRAPKSSIPNARILLSSNLGLHQNDTVFATNLTSDELFIRYPCGIPSLRFFLPNVTGNGGKELKDEVLENLERVPASNQVFTNACGQPSLEFFLPDGNPLLLFWILEMSRQTRRWSYFQREPSNRVPFVVKEHVASLLARQLWAGEGSLLEE